MEQRRRDGPKREARGEDAFEFFPKKSRMAAARQSDVSVKDVEAKLEEAYQILRSDKENIPDRLYHALEGISSVFYAWHHSNGKQGWSTSLVDPKGKPYFTKQQRNLLEDAFENYGPLFTEVFEEAAMVGGATSMGNVQQGATSELVKLIPAVNPENVSMDKLYYTITSKMDQYDQQWKSIADSLGIVRAVEQQDYKGTLIIPMTPPIPVPYYILGKTIFPFLTTVLDMLRLALGNPLLDMFTVRIFLSIVLAIIDLLRGDWQTALLSSLGIFSSSGVIIGILGKIIRNAWMFIAPDLQKQLREDIYRSSKSMVIGFLLWSFSIFSPDAIRLAVNQSFEKMKEIVDKFNQKVSNVEGQVQKVAGQAGVKVTFPRVPLTIIPSMDDIQNLQTIARVPEVYCSPEVQAILQPVLLVPPLRLVLELLNIPTVPEMVKEQCKGVDTTSLAKAVAEKVTPDVEVIPGGPLNQVQAAANTVKNTANKAKAAVNTVKNTANAVVNQVKKGGRQTRKKRRS